MKYSNKDYEDAEFYGIEEDGAEHCTHKLVKCRVIHNCASCGADITVGESALRETGFLDGYPVSCYTCIKCLDKWIDETIGNER